MDVGDIVIIKEEDVPRNEWKLAMVVKAHEEADGLVRKVTVQVWERKLGKGWTSQSTIPYSKTHSEASGPSEE